MMHGPFSEPIVPQFVALAEAVVRTIDRPVMIVANGSDVVAANAECHKFVTFHQSEGEWAALGECLAGFGGGESLVHSLATGSESVGVVTLTLPGASRGALRQNGSVEYTARWRQVELPSPSGSCAVITFENQTENQHLASAAFAYQGRIDELLIRQTLIEEQERRRIGRDLHDGVCQTLAHLRHLLLREGAPTETRDALTPFIDEVIMGVRDLAFELSPPVLEDLGLLPAIEWLAGFFRNRYGAEIHFASDEREPMLTSAARVVAFRAVRELVFNAAKHAADEEIVVICRSTPNTVRLTVRDSGPGFDPGEVHGGPGSSRFGLVSVEQQIRGLGGTFDLYSAVGDGTRVAITLPCEEPTRHTPEHASE